MHDFLEEKGVKFEDERLNAAINMVALTKEGKKKMNFLIDNLSVEAIRVIDSKQYVYNIDGENGSKVDSFFSDCDDSSYNKVFSNITIIKNDVAYNYRFHIGYFNNTCCFDSSIFDYNEFMVFFDDKGNINKTINIDGKDMNVSLQNKKNNKLFEFEGLVVSHPSINEDKCDKLRINIKNLLDNIRDEFKDRVYYQTLNKEIIKTYYKNKYDYNNSEKQLEFARYHELVAKGNELVFYINNGIEEYNGMSAIMQYNMLIREIDDINFNTIEDGYLTFNEWCIDKDIYTPYEMMDYNEWSSNKGRKKVVINMDSVPFNKCDDKEVRESIYYNPNKMRYLDEDEKIITDNKKC